MAESRRQQLLAKSWTAVAMEYERRLAPLFQPWISQLVTLFTSQTLPEGAIYAPACGPGEELVLLAQALPGHHKIVGADLAQGMVDLAQQRIAQMTHARHTVSARVGDATVVPADLRPLAGVFSCFGLQQMPRPQEVLRAWLAALAPDGVLAVCYWPPSQGQRDAAWRALTADPSAPATAPAWDDGLREAAETAGAIVLEDLAPCHTISFDSADEAWQVMMHAGPLHSRLLRYGEQHMEELRGVFLGNVEAEKRPFDVRPNARVLLLRRKRLAASM